MSDDKKIRMTAGYHNHTTFCDGKNTPAEMAAAAFAKGFTDFGFSGHSCVHDVNEASFGVADEGEYVRVLRALQREYAGKMHIAIGMEQDYVAPVQNRAALDYCIGSVHELYDAKTGKHFAVDSDAATLRAGIDEMFGGDAMAMVRDFYDTTVKNVAQYQPEIIGHFDLVVKNNANGDFFDENSAVYRNLALDALRTCAKSGAIFEVNTGSMARGYRDAPYPTRFLLEELCRLNARVMITTDAHCVATIDFGYEMAYKLLKEIGFTHVCVPQNGEFLDKSL
ncbi:MAG: histidinol-phosphatase HisJ family protein [Ruthenibacterium sp.]